MDLAESDPGQVRVLDACLQQRIASSLGPWEGPEYIAGFVPAGSLPADLGASRLKFDPSQTALLHRVGISQAFFPPQPSEYSYPTTTPESKPDEELLESLPYH